MYIQGFKKMLFVLLLLSVGRRGREEKFGDIMMCRGRGQMVGNGLKGWISAAMVLTRSIFHFPSRIPPLLGHMPAT